MLAIAVKIWRAEHPFPGQQVWRSTESVSQSFDWLTRHLVMAQCGISHSSSPVVVHRPHPRLSSHSDLSINHGCVVLYAAPKVQLTPVAINCPMTAIEVSAARVNAGYNESVVVDVYRPGSDAVQCPVDHLWQVVTGVPSHRHLSDASSRGRWLQHLFWLPRWLEYKTAA